MADISEWSPVDESNNQPPPNGFPEFQSPSSLNNGARAMMGAVRRWYDTVTAQLTSLTASLAGYLPLTGGTLTGNLTVNGSGGLYLSGVQLRNTGGGGLDVSTTTGTGGGGIYVHGPESGVYWGDTDQVSPAWGWYATAGTAYFWQSVTGNVLTVTSSGIVSASVALNTVQYQIVGVPFAERVGGTAHHIYDVGGNLALALHAGESYYRANTHHWQNDAGTETATLNSAGGLALTASVSAPAVTATGTVSGNLLTGGSVSSNTTSNALQFNLRSVPFAVMDAGFGSTVLYDPSSAANITMYAAAGGNNYYDQNTHNFRNRGGGSQYAIFSAGGTFNALGGVWGTISEAGLKEDITPYVRGLDAVLALDPVSFVYRAGVPFADEARTVRYGLLADAVAPVLPETVGEAEFEIDGALRTVQTLQLGPLTFVLLNAVKELAARIEALEGGP